MSQGNYAYDPYGQLAGAGVRESERAAFIRATYLHLAGAILAFAALQALIFTVFLPTEQARLALAARMFGSPIAALLLMAAFIGVGFVAQRWASADMAPTMQYLGLGLYVSLQAVIMFPLLCYVTDIIRQPDLILTAGWMTLAIFGGLTTAVLVSKKDFSFLRTILIVGGWVALAVLLCGVIFGFTLGLFFSFAMVALVSGYILYDTSNVLHHYRPGQHVAAALALFADVALMFYYILRILIATRD